MAYQILEEQDVIDLITPELAIDAMRGCFEEKANGTFSALPKFNIMGVNGPLRITPGESQNFSNCIGFRVYDVIRKDYSDQEQVVIVYDNTSGKLKGVIVSQLIGAYRTAAINAVIHNSFKKKHVEVLGIVGIGYQAKIHAILMAKLLQPSRIEFYARNEEKALKFQEEMKPLLSCGIEFNKSIDNLYSHSDSLLLATNSRTAILDEHQVKKGVTITTIGPKLKGASEVAENFAKNCSLIVSDSIEQVEAYGTKFFVDPNTVQDYSAMIKNNSASKQSENDKILICSVGMGGTEVVLGSILLDKKLAL